MKKIDNLLWKYVTETWTNEHKLDEFQSAYIQKVLAKMSVYTTYVLLPILTIAGVVYDSWHNQFSFSTILLFGLLTLNILIVYFCIQKNNILDTELETREEHKQALQQLKRQTMKKGFIFFFIMLLGNNVGMRLLFNEPLFEMASWVRGFIGAMIGTILFVVAYYHITRDKIKQVPLED
ncbi:hypothetical protein NHG23_07640 [Aerococcaceae bacterium NML190073]|nr:hypothetical protein [Aerococcaceae bacterium NML190073]